MTITASVILDTRRRMTGPRIAGPNSQTRQIRLIGIGGGGQRIARGIGTLQLASVAIHDQAADDAAGSEALQQFLASADMIVVVAHADDTVEVPPAIRQFARDHALQITGVLLQPAAHQSSTASAAMLARLRASSDMLIVAADESYITDMLVQFGA